MELSYCISPMGQQTSECSLFWKKISSGFVASIRSPCVLLSLYICVVAVCLQCFAVRLLRCTYEYIIKLVF